MKIFNFIFILLISGTIIAQESQNMNFTDLMSAPDANYYEIKELADNYFAQNHDETEGGGYANYKRWEWFWHDRVQDYEGNPGSFIPANKAILELFENGICNANNQQSDWILLGPDKNIPNHNWKVNIGRIDALAVDPNDHNTMYVASYTSGLWKTTNAFDPEPVWVSLMDELHLPGVGINQVLIDPTNSNIIYAATGYSSYGGYGIGILKSIDGGQSWLQTNPLPPNPDNITKKMVIDYSNPDILYALVNDMVFKTVDGGNSWTMVYVLPDSDGDTPFPQGPARKAKDIAIHPTDPNIVYIASNDHHSAIACGWIDAICINGGTMFFCDDFESGGLAAGGWNTQGNTVISDQMADEGNYCFRGTGEYSLEKEFSSLGNNIEVEFSIRGTQSVKTRDVVRFNLLDENGNTGPSVILSYSEGEKKLIACDGTQFNFLQSFSDDTWYTIKLQVNIQSKTYNVFVNNELLALTHSFYSPNFTKAKKFRWDCDQDGNDGSIICRTTDGGDTWEVLEVESGGTTADVISIAVTPAEPNSVFASYRPILTRKTTIKKSTDQGETWTTVSTPNLKLSGFDTWRNDIVVSPTDADIVYVAGYFANKSINGGYTFSQQASGQHVDCRTIEIISGSVAGSEGAQDFLIQGHDGGVAITTQGGNPWYDINGKGLAVTQFYAMGCSQKDYLVGGGTQDNHSCIFNGNDWKYAGCCDGGEIVFDKNNPDVAYVQSWHSGEPNRLLYKYNYNGIKWNNLGNFAPDYGYGDLIRPMVMHDNGQLYMGSRNLFKSNTPDLAWNKISDFKKLFNPNRSNISSIAVAPSNENVILVSFGANPTWVSNSEGYLFKSTGGGGLDQTDWNDISANLPSYIPQWFTITDIEFDPENEDRIWLTIGRFAVNDGEWRVYKSEDGGINWEDYSEGLTKFPVNNIIYQKGSNDGLYVATDVGVFYRNATMHQWECYNNGLPVCLITDLDINYCEGKLFCSTFGRGMWESGLAENPSVTYQICDGGLSVWDINKYSVAELKVCSGNTLTIKSKVEFTNEGKLIIEPGAKLILDGGTLTNGCGEFWQGIEVWGDPNTSNSYAQGWLEIKNNATIENAFTAIKNYNFVNGSYYEDYGGVVLAYDANFINNHSSADLRYHGWALFENCLFETNDESYVHASDVSHVNLTEMDNVIFESCAFSNVSSHQGEGFGIWSINSDFTVKGDDRGNNSRFNDLFYGIIASGSGSPAYPVINNCDFNGNFRGVSLTGISNAEVLYNNFNINDAFTENGGCGLYLDNSTGYRVEENHFRNAEQGVIIFDEIGIGIVVHNSGSDPNEIYRNTFTELQQGISAQGHNKNMNSSTAGLELRCNDFNDCRADVLVPMPRNNDWGIALFQGYHSSNPEDMAGNLFHIESPIPDGDFDDINNEADYFLYYYPGNYDPDDDDVKPIDYTEYSVDVLDQNIVPYDWTFNDGCPQTQSSGGGSGGGGTPTHKSTSAGGDLKEQLTRYSGKVDSVEKALSALIDGGDTPGLKNKVKMSTPPQAMDVYQKLMGETPYLSATVMESAIEKETVFPNAMVRDVMVASPDPAASDKLMKKSDERDIPMPDYMKAQVLESRKTLTDKTKLESKLAGYKRKYARAFNSLLRQYLSDTINPQAASDSLVALYQSAKDKNKKYSLAMLHLQRGEYNKGKTVLNKIASQFDITAEEMPAHNNMKNYYKLMSKIKKAGRKVWEADSTEIQELFTIKQADSGLAGVYARNVLIALKEIEYLAPIYLPDIYKSSVAMEEYTELKETKLPSHLEVFPNPSNDYVIVHYQVEKDIEGFIEVIDMNGTTIMQTKINRSQDEVTMNTIDWKPGMYIASLKINGKSVENVKFTVIK